MDVDAIVYISFGDCFRSSSGPAALLPSPPSFFDGPCHCRIVPPTLPQNRPHTSSSYHTHEANCHLTIPRWTDNPTDLEVRTTPPIDRIIRSRPSPPFGMQTVSLPQEPNSLVSQGKALCRGEPDWRGGERCMPLYGITPSTAPAAPRPTLTTGGLDRRRPCPHLLFAGLAERAAC